jgi:hypothetical protein
MDLGFFSKRGIFAESKDYGFSSLYLPVLSRIKIQKVINQKIMDAESKDYGFSSLYLPVLSRIKMRN